MRIGVNVVPLRANSGGARYVFAALFRQLLQLDREHRYVVFAHPAGVDLVREIVDGADQSAAEASARVRIVAVADEEFIYPRRDEFDLYFNPINSLKPRILDRPTVAILHDIQEQYLPQYFSYADLMSRHEVYPEMCRAATIVVTVSEFCKRSLVEKFGVDPRKIEVVYNAPQAELICSDPNDGGSWSAAPVPKPFFFYPANTYPHKNHALLLDAMQILARECRNSDAGSEVLRRAGSSVEESGSSEYLRTGVDREHPGDEPAFAPHAVFTGQPMPGGYPLDEEIKKRNLTDQCHVLNHLSAAEMRYLYRNAAAVVMPTMFEGFGMPAVEALACGSPLVCSDIPALREVAGDNALYFPPGDLDALCARMRQILTDGALRSQLAQRGYEIAQRFTWESAGRKLLKVFAEAGERFTFGYCAQETIRPRPSIGILVRNNGPSGSMAATMQSLIDTKYENLVVGVINGASAPRDSLLKIVKISDEGQGDLHALMNFAGRENLDLVGMMNAGNRMRPSGLSSLALSLADAESCSVHLGEVVVWRGNRYRGIARIRYTGDNMWRIEKLLYPEMFFLAAAAFAKWPAGKASLPEAGDDWRWKLLLAARVENQLAIVRRTLADCDRSSLPWLAWIKAFRAGMLDFHRLDNSPAPVPILRRFERRVRMFSQLLPQSVQHLGTKWWYRLTRP